MAEPPSKPPSAVRLRRARDAAGLTQEALARAADVSVGLPRRWEREGIEGKRDAGKLQRVAGVLGVPLDWLLGSGPDDPPIRG